MDKFRPSKLNNFCGQTHLVGEGAVIKTLLDKSQMRSAIFYGPSGTGKTTLANIIASTLEINVGFFNAAINNKKDLTQLIENANYYDNYLIIIDEIHRMNKDKQDILLPYLEMSKIIVIGLTTFNPYHSVNPAIRSRMQIFEFKQLNEDDIKSHLLHICSEHFSEFTFEEEVIDLVVSSSNGDLRYAINQLDMLSLLAEENSVTTDVFAKLNPRKSLLIDKNSDYYYDLLSAFQKSLRGSDVDASLHYLAQLVNLGDLEIICRRLIIISYEDVGLANPTLHERVLNAINSALMVGFPEARIILSHAVIEIALSPKSNTAYLAIAKALDDTTKNYNLDVPDTIKQHTTTYTYPHDYGGWVDQQYLPDELIGQQYIKFKNNKYEQKLKEFYEKISKLKK